MTATAEGAVDVTTGRLNPEAVERFLQQDGEVIGTSSLC
jgi:hypothetical protein